MPAQGQPGYPLFPAQHDHLGRDLVGRDGMGLPAPTYGPRHLAESWEGPVNPNRTLPSRRHGLQWLFVIPMLLPLLTPLYNRRSPYLFGLPFFYWYQLGCVLVAIFVLFLVYQLTKGRRPRWPR